MLRSFLNKIRLKSLGNTDEQNIPVKPEAYSDTERLNLNISSDITKNWDIYEMLYLGYADTQAHLDIITALTVGNGFRFVGEESKVKLCERFAKQVNLSQILENLVLTCLIFGNSYAIIVRDSDELPSTQNDFGISLFIPHPKKIKILVNRYGDIESYWYDPNVSFIEKEYLFEPRYVLHFRLKNYADKPYGLSLLHSVYKILKIKKSIEQMSAVMAFRSSHGLLWAKVQLSEQDCCAVNPETGKTFAEEKLEKIAEALSCRVKETGDVVDIKNNIVLDQTVELKNLAVQNDFSGVAKVLEHLQEQVDRALKVPKVFLGQPEGSNRATSYNQLLVFKLFIESIQRKFEAEINRKLMPLIVDGVEFRFNPPLKEDISELVDQATKLCQYGVIDLNEARMWVGLPPKPEEEEL